MRKIAYFCTQINKICSICDVISQSNFITMLKFLVNLTLLFSSVLCWAQTPGGVSSNLQTWFDANNGTSGSPVNQWNNLGPNANITKLTSVNGGTLFSADEKANYNNIVKTSGGYNGTFHAEVPTRTQLISGNEVTMYVAYQKKSSPDLTFEFHGSIQTDPASNGANQWLAWGFRHSGKGTHFSNGQDHLYNNVYLSTMSKNSGFAGLYGRSNSTGGNSLDGINSNYGNIGSFHAGGNYMELSIGYWPGYGMKRGVMEAILWDRNLSLAERKRVETYLAIKYGITLGFNGTSMDYISPTTGNVIWSNTSNAGFNSDIAGLGRSDVSGLSQLKSHSTNGPNSGDFNDILTVSNGTNFNTPSSLSSDDSYFIWGHNGGATNNTGTIVNFPTDNGEVIETIFSRQWKSQETGTVGTVMLEFDMNGVAGVGAVAGSNDLANLRLLIDEDGDYSFGATSISPSSFDNTTNIAYFEIDFVPSTANPLAQNNGFFFTLGSTEVNATPLPVTLESINVQGNDCANRLFWTTLSEQNSSHFTILRSLDLVNWATVGSVEAAGTSTSKLNYSFRDAGFDQNGMVYYKLIQFDTDGTKTELGIVGVDAFCQTNIEPMIYPNPVANDLMIKSANAGSVIVMDIQGKIVLSQDLSVGLSVFDVTNIDSGVYVVLINENNGRSFKEKFIKL